MTDSSIGRVSDRRRRLVFVATALGTFIVTANVSTMNVAFPSLEQTFSGSSRGALTWVLNSYTIAFAAFLIPSGRLADRFGRRPVFVVGLALFAASSALVGVGPTLPLVIGARVLQGMSGALVVPASLGLLLAGSSRADRTSVVARWGAVTALGVATGPSLGALVVDTLSWRWAFLLLPPFCALSWALGRDVLPRTTRDPDAPWPDAIGATLLAGAMAVLAFAIVQIRAWGWSSTGVVIALIVAAVLFSLLAVRSSDHPAPALPTHLFRIRSFSMANIANTVQTGSLSASLLVNVLWLTGGWDYTILQAGLATLPSPLLVAVLAPLAGRWGSTYGVRVFAVPASLLWGIGVLGYVVLVRDEPDWLLTWLGPSLVVALGIAFTFPLVSALVVSEVGPDDFAVAGAINQVGRQLGATIGVAALITIIGDAGDLDAFRRAWIVIAAMGPVAAVCVALTAPVRRRRQPEAES